MEEWAYEDVLWHRFLEKEPAVSTKCDYGCSAVTSAFSKSNMWIPHS